MTDFKVRRGKSSLLFSAPGVVNPALIIEDGCWYLCTDTADLYVGIILPDGTSVTISKVTESAADGGSNVVTFSDGKTVTIKNGSKGDKGDTGSDYVMTDADTKALLAEVRATSNQQTPLFANSIEECTDITKVYVLPDGYIYGHILTEVAPPTITIEGKAGGYYETGPKWASASGYCGKYTNIFPVTAGDKLRYKGYARYGAISVSWYDASKVQISSQQFNEGEWNAATYEVTVPTGAVYAQFFSYKDTADLANVTLEVSWILCQASGVQYGWASTGHSFVPTDYEARILAIEESLGGTTSVLKGKKIVYDGDSIAESRTGTSANNGGGYAKLIAEKTGCTYVNQAVGGAYLRSTTVSGKHSVVDNLANLPKDGDLYCFEGGINDYWNNATLGTFSKTDFTGTLDVTTVCGALETIFRYALTNFVGKPICFVIAHKIQNTAYTKNHSTGDTFEDYRNAMVGICEKYSIPYYDAFSESGLNGWNTVQNNAYLTANANGTADGTHPNAEGYKRYYVPQLVALFERIMPL